MRVCWCRLVWLVLAAFGLAGRGSVQAAVVVLANQTERSVAVSVRLSGGREGEITLPPGQLTAVPAADSVEATFATGKVRHRVRLELNCLYYFVPEGDEVELKRAVFSRAAGTAWMHVDPSGEIPRPVVVPVKILVDDEQPAVRRIWEPEVNRQIEAASRIFQKYCRVEFRVVAVGTWESDNDLKSFQQLREEFRREVSPDAARLAIGVTSQYLIPGPEQVPHDDLDPLCSHLLLPAAQKNLSTRDQLTLLVHSLGHFLGAVATANDDSMMGVRFPRGIERLRQTSLAFDPVNTLVMNLVAEEIRARDCRSLGDVPRSTRMYLHAIYTQMARGPNDEAARYAALVEESVPKRARYTAVWVDGSRHTADGVESWHETASRPKLAGRYLFDESGSVRWLLDSALVQADPPPAAVEMVGGDVLPGRVVAFNTGLESEGLRLPPYMLVTPYESVDWPDGPVRQSLQVPTRWVRRVIWQRATDRYQPATLIYRDGRRLEFRSLRPDGDGIRVLTGEGVRRVGLQEIAELHLPRSDCWDAYFDQLAVLAPDGRARLMQLETGGGLRVTASAERFQARPRGSASDSRNWYHLVQPAWCLQPLWIAHEQIRLRCYFLPHEVPLSRIEPAVQEEQSDLGGAWPWRFDRNVEGGPLAGGDRVYHWGLGVHALSQLAFPLPSCARSFHSRLGLDTLAGDGGCVQAAVFLGPTTGKPLFAGPLLIGSTDVLDTGPLRLEASSGTPGPLVLRVDAASRQRPRGADPLDIRDTFGWLEPLVELEPAGLRAEIARRAPGLVPAWQDWTVEVGPSKAPLLVNVWDEGSDSREAAYRSLVQTGGAALKLSRTFWVSPKNDRLLLTVSRPPGATPSTIEVQIDGRTAGQFEIPEHKATAPPKPLELSLAGYRQRQVSVCVSQQSADERSLVRWWALALAGSPAEKAGGNVGQ